jgi:hypothetical protein
VEGEGQCVHMRPECGQQRISEHGACGFELIYTVVGKHVIRTRYAMGRKPVNHDHLSVVRSRCSLQKDIVIWRVINNNDRIRW